MQTHNFHHKPAPLAWVWLSLLLAFMTDMLPLGAVAWRPSILVVVMLYWVIYRSDTVGMGVAFMLGLLMDVNDASPLGHHALIYSVMAFLTTLMHRRLIQFPLATQTIQMVLVFVAGILVALVLRLALGGSFPGLGIIAAPFLQAIMWFLLSMFLRAGQRWFDKSRRKDLL